MTQPENLSPASVDATNAPGVVETLIPDSWLGWSIWAVAILLAAAYGAYRYLKKDKVVGAAAEAGGDELRKFGREFVGLFWLLRCLIYVGWWRVSLPIRKTLKSGVTFLTLGSALLFVLESLGPDRLQDFLHHYIGFKAKVVVGAFGFWTVYHRWKELRRSGERNVFANGVRHLFTELSSLKFQGDHDERQKTLEDFVDKVLVVFWAIFRGSKTSLNIMLPSQQDGLLRVTRVYPKTRVYDGTLALAPGVGAAGFAYETTKAVYIPAITYLHGVTIQFPTLQSAVSDSGAGGSEIEYDLKRNLYVRCGVEPYRSILCVPIVGTGTKPVGVLNFDSDLRKPYTDIDMTFAAVAAAALAMLFDRFEASKP